MTTIAVVAKDAGFDYHLVKPVSFEALYDLLASCRARGIRCRPERRRPGEQIEATA